MKLDRSNLFDRKFQTFENGNSKSISLQCWISRQWISSVCAFGPGLDEANEIAIWSKDLRSIFVRVQQNEKRKCSNKISSKSLLPLSFEDHEKSSQGSERLLSKYGKNGGSLIWHFFWKFLFSLLDLNNLEVLSKKDFKNSQTIEELTWLQKLFLALEH